MQLPVAQIAQLEVEIMIFAEVLALLGVAVFGVLGLNGISAWMRSSRSKATEDSRFLQKMQEDLRDALKSRDYRRLEDWMVIYADHVTSETRKHVSARRDELYIDTK